MITQASDDPFAAYQKPLATHTTPKAKDDPFAAYQKPLAVPEDFTANLKREGTYSMLDKGGKEKKIPYSAVGRAATAGYAMKPEDRETYVKDSAADPHRGEGVSLPEGVVVAGRNSAGQPIYASATSPQFSHGLQTLDDLLTWHRAVKTRVEPGMYTPSSPKVDQALTSIHNVGARGIQDVESMVRHPLNAAAGMVALGKEVMGALAGIKTSGPIEERVEEFKRDYAVDPRKAIENAAGDVLGLYMSGKLAEATMEGVKLPSGKMMPQSLRGKTTPGLINNPPVKAVGKYVTETAPMRAISNLIKPSAADVKFGKSPAKAILDEGIVASDLHGLGDKVYKRLSEVGKKINKTVADAQSADPSLRVDLSQSLMPIYDAMRDARTAGNVGLFNRLSSLENELTHQWSHLDAQGNPYLDAQGNITIKPAGLRTLRMTPDKALEFKRIVGDRVQWTGNDPFENAANEALGRVYGEIKDGLNRKVKGLKESNEQYANLVGAAKAIERRLPVEERNAAWSLSDIVLGSTGHIPTMIARKVVTWPGARTVAARTAYRMRGGFPAAGTALAGAAAVSSATQQPTQPLKTLKELQAEAARLKGSANQPAIKPVKMRAPDGSIEEVPYDQVDHYKSEGAIEVKSE